MIKYKINICIHKFNEYHNFQASYIFEHFPQLQNIDQPNQHYPSNIDHKYQYSSLKSIESLAQISPQLIVHSYISSLLPNSSQISRPPLGHSPSNARITQTSLPRDA